MIHFEKIKIEYELNKLSSAVNKFDRNQVGSTHTF
jgi:hypothetical protein